MNEKERSRPLEVGSSFNHLRSRMTHVITHPVCKHEELASLRQRAALSRTVAVLRDLAKNMGMN